MDDVETLPRQPVVDARQVGIEARILIGPTQVFRPAALGEGRNPRPRALGPEDDDLVAHPGQLGMEQVDDQLRPTVAARR
jgi:hypothetical protein